MRKLKKIMNRVHAILTTGKSAAAGLGSVLTSFGTGLAIHFGANNAAVIGILAVGAAATSFSAWQIPYEPFEV